MSGSLGCIINPTATDHLHLDPIRELEIKLGMPNLRIVFVQLIELALCPASNSVLFPHLCLACEMRPSQRTFWKNSTVSK